MTKFSNNIAKLNITRNSNGDFDKINLTFQYEGSAEDLHYVSTSCGSCTDASIEGNTVKAVFDPNMAIPYGTEGDVKIPIDKYIFVYLNPKEPEYIADGFGKRVQNPNKQRLDLKITGTINN